MKNLADIRKDYQLQELDESGVLPNPINQFSFWFQQALDSNAEEVNAMTLATASKEGRPSARIVLLKGVENDCFIFFTNYESQKARDMHENPQVSLVFFWKELERQVRIAGRVLKTTPEESDAYFYSRPAGSQLGAWASPQSDVISSRKILDANIRSCEEKFSGKKIERPPHWGGYSVKPTEIEFWQGRTNRLHDRIRYSLTERGVWVIERLAP